MTFVCEALNSSVDDILTYNEILDYTRRDKIDIENDTE
jgi:DNA-binding Xre family transcriptional regulator